MNIYNHYIQIVDIIVERFDIMNILVSACLLGVDCRYDGSSSLHDCLDKLKEDHHFIPVCPEIFGGLKTPRDPAEKQGDIVMTMSGENVTSYFEKGATETLKLAQFFHCKLAILKERSPSCGYGKIYDGTFSGKLIDGNGVTAELLLANHINVIGETQIEQYFSNR